MDACIFMPIPVLVCLYASLLVKCACMYVSPHTHTRHPDHMSEFSISSETDAYMRAYMCMHIVTHSGVHYDDVVHKLG